MRLIRAGIVAALLLAFAAGCGESDERVVAAESSDDVSVGMVDGLTAAESRWVASSRIDSFLGTMQLDIASFTRRGFPQDGFVFSDENGPQYGCRYALTRGGRPPTARMTRIREHAREACRHLQRALEHALVFKAVSPAGPAREYQANRASVEREARLATTPAAKARTQLDDARIR